MKNLKINFCELHVWQLVPEYPTGHMQIYDEPLVWQVAPFWQGLL